MILLPTLLRQATGRRDLGFQVAPGLAEVSPDAVATLDLTASRVAYAVDNDAAGRQIHRKLRSAGIPDDRVIYLGRQTIGNLVLEDTLKPEIYQSGINAEIARSHPGVKPIPLAVIPDARRPRAVERWCASEGITPPNRAAVANRILELKHKPLLSVRGKALIRDLHRDLERILGLP